MAVEVYQGTITPNTATTYQQAVKEIFTLAGYSVTPDATNKRVTVDSGGNIFGHESFGLRERVNAISTPLVMVVDKDQHALIVSQSVAAKDTFSSSSGSDPFASSVSLICMLVGDIDPMPSVGGKTFSSAFNFPDITFNRVSGQPAIICPCIDNNRDNLAPVFVAANGVVYPLGTYITDGSTKFVSNGNGLLIKVKGQ